MRQTHVTSLPVLTLTALAALAACSSAQDSESTGATHDSLDLASGGTTVATESCPASGGITALCKGIGVCTGPAPTCDSKTRQLFTGTELLPSHSGTPSWNGFGGRGRVLADAGLCILRDLGVNGPITTPAAGTGSTTATQTIGFLSFDPTNKIMKGYRQLRACVPLFGCIDTRPQTFTVSEQRAFVSGTSNGTYPIFGEAALQITADETSQSMTIAPPVPISVATPYGVISVTPSFHYEGGEQMLSAPFQGESKGQGQQYPLVDTYGMSPGGTFTAQHQWTPGTGWDSVIALGSRMSTATWSGSGNPPRPDGDMTKARSAAENAPGIASAQNGELISVSANIEYAPPISALPAPIQSLITQSGVDFEFRVFVRPHYDTKFAGQMQLRTREEAWWAMDSHPAHISTSEIAFDTSVGESSTLSIEAGLDLVLKIDLGFAGSLTILNLHPTFDVPITPSTPGTALGPTAIASIKETDSNPPLTTVSAWHASYSKFTTLKSGGQNVADPNAFITSCLANAPAPKTIPAGGYSPPNPATLPGGLYPCNVCVANVQTTWTDQNGASHTLPAESKTALPSTTSATPLAWTCKPVHAGCFDMCAWDPATGAKTVVKSAAISNPTMCMNEAH
jgi:hypothetical protein